MHTCVHTLTTHGTFLLTENTELIGKHFLIQSEVKIVGGDKDGLLLRKGTEPEYTGLITVFFFKLFPVMTLINSCLGTSQL